MSQVRCCLCGDWTDDDIDKDMSTIVCPLCAGAEALERSQSGDAA